MSHFTASVAPRGKNVIPVTRVALGLNALLKDFAPFCEQDSP
jgi:hypothetical protein